MRAIEITGSDDRMDCRDLFEDGPIQEAVNRLPRKCPRCEFPDLDFVPQPYFLIKSRTLSPNEVAIAQSGNLLCRERIKQILDTVAPGQCAFYPTHYLRSDGLTPWLLAVPANQVATGKVEPTIPRCELCGEPRSAHPGSQWVEGRHGPGWTGEFPFDILKSSTWASSELGWQKWIHRRVLMSVRLLQLLKRANAKGLYEATCGEPVAPNQIEATWIDEQLSLIQEQGIPMHAAGTLSKQDASWLKAYLNRKGKAAASAMDLKAIERQLKVKLPKSYCDFICRIGPTTFNNVDEQRGFTVHILPPHELDYEEFRIGSLPLSDEESAGVDGLMFARTDFGDSFCFDLQKGSTEYPVVLYKHECQYFEPYAENFAACLKRFTGG